MQKELKAVFMGTPDFAVGVLKAMVENDIKVVGVVTAPDRPAGRGRKLQASAVKEYALLQQLEVLQPTNLKNPQFLKHLESLEANVYVVVAFRMLPKVVWQMPEYGTFNLHASLLPQYRGAAPINWAIINQETKTGVTTFFIDEKIDTGSIIAQKQVFIADRETAGSLHDKLMKEGSFLVLETLKHIEKGEAHPRPQQALATLRDAPKLTSENTRIDWSKKGAEIDAFVRGLSPYPAAWTVLYNDSEELKAKIYAGRFEPGEHRENPGQISASKKRLQIACGDGYYMVEEMQLPGKKKMPVVSLLNGFSFAEKARFV